MLLNSKLFSLTSRLSVYDIALGTRTSARVPPSCVINHIRFYSKECGIVNIQGTEDFCNKVTQNENPVLVDFHATWCKPCKILGPRLDSVMKKYMEKILLAKVDVDTYIDLASQYKIEAVPTVIGMKNGQEVSRFSGLKEEAEIERFINNLIK